MNGWPLALMCVLLFGPFVALGIWGVYDWHVVGPRRVRDWEQENERLASLGLPRNPCKPTTL